MMVRTQISIESELHSRIRARAAALGISFAEYIRRLVDKDLACLPRNIDRSIIFDLGTSEPSDIAAQKDQLIAESTDSGKTDNSAVP